MGSLQQQLESAAAEAADKGSALAALTAEHTKLLAEQQQLVAAVQAQHEATVEVRVGRGMGMATAGVLEGLARGRLCPSQPPSS